MKFKQMFQAILDKLGFVDKAKNKQLTIEEWKQIEDSFKETHGVDLFEAMNKESENAQKAAQYDAALQALGTVTENSNENGAGGNDTAKPENLAGVIQDFSMRNETLAAENAQLKAENEKLANMKANDGGKEVPVNLNISGGQHTATHLFGVEHETLAMTHRWNQITAGRAANLGTPSAAETQAFFAAFTDFKESFANRIDELHKNGQLSAQALSQIDYSQLKDAGLGEQFLVRRTDALIARIINLPSVDGIFPMRYGIQDGELMTNAFFGEFSQAWQEGEVFKGSYELQPEKARVDDAMIKVRFKSMKWIERQYIGYLNTSGSDPIKWTMIEWLLLNIATKANSERNSRRVIGDRVEPKEGVAGHYLHASVGAVPRIISYVDKLKVLPFSSDLYQNYDETTILEAVEAFIDEAQEYCSSFVGKALYLNINYRKAYATAYRKKYAVQIDFASTTSKVQDVDDLEIIWVPNMNKIKFMWLTDKGNVQGLGLLPGEMHKTSIETRLENVLAWSVWKEGTAASFAGKKFETLAELEANDFENQAIFCANPVLPIPADATEFDASFGLVFKTGENTQATTLENITVKPGIVVKIVCGSTTNKTKIAKSGKFSDVTAWNPTKVGDWIKVYYDSKTKKFVEVARG